MNIKELKERDIKNAWGRIWKKAKTEIPPSEAKELAGLALEKAKAYSKLREIVDILPNIKTGLSIMANNPDMMQCERDGAANTLRKLEQWETP